MQKPVLRKKKYVPLLMRRANSYFVIVKMNWWQKPGRKVN